jgi:predicted permease
MRWLAILRLRLEALLSSRRLDAELDEEMRFHVERQTEELVAQGYRPEEALGLARLQFGRDLGVREDCREARGLRLLDEFSQDVRYSVRSLFGTPTITAVALLTLALGIGANTAAFSVINSVLLRPLPYPSPEQLVWVTQYFPRFDARLVSGNDFLAWEEESRSFERLAAWSAGTYTVRTDETAERVRGVSVSPNYFEALGVQPLVGRLFSTEEHGPAGDAVVVIGERLWRERFDASEHAVGELIQIDHQPHLIVGVIPTTGEYVEPGRLWIPLRLTRAQVGEPVNLVRVLGRLNPSVDAGAAATEIELLARRGQEAQFGAPSDSLVEILPLHEKLVGKVGQSLLLLWGAVGLVLLLVCANVANLLLGKMVGRASEVSLKLSLGAQPLRLARQFLTESLMLSLTGAAVGALLAAKGLPVLVEFLPVGAARWGSITIDQTTLVFTLCVAVAAAAAFGTLPALYATRTSLSQGLKSSSQTLRGGHSASRLQDGLVICQFAAATLVVFAASLLTHTFLNLRAVEPGFDPAGLVTAEVQLPASEFRDNSEQLLFFREVLDRAREVPGVSQAAVTTGLPFSTLDGHMAFFSVENGAPWGSEEAPAHRTRVHSVTPEFFDALGVELQVGSAITEHSAAALTSVIVSAAFAAQAFGSDAPLGRRLKLGIPEGPDPWLTVVGVVGDVRHAAVNLDEVPVVYRSYTEASSLSSAAMVVRSSRVPGNLMPELRNAVRQVDDAQPLHGLMTMQQHMAQTMISQRERALLLGSFAALALVLAGSGVFGVMAYLVARRKREFGVRMALGAEPRDLFGLVVAQGLRRAAMGTGLGCVAALATARLLQGLLFGVGEIDFTSLFVTCAVLIAVAILACWLPARRASRLDPAAVLRME